MSRFDELKPSSRIDLRDRAAKLLVKDRFRVNKIKLRNRGCGHLDRRQLRAQLIAQPEKYSRDLARLSLVQTLQLVVCFDRLERLYKSRRARRRITVRDALHAPTMIGFDWNHKTIVTNRDQFVLNRLRRALHQSFQ